MQTIQTSMRCSALINHVCCITIRRMNPASCMSRTEFCRPCRGLHQHPVTDSRCAIRKSPLRYLVEVSRRQTAGRRRQRRTRVSTKLLPTMRLPGIVDLQRLRTWLRYKRRLTRLATYTTIPKHQSVVLQHRWFTVALTMHRLAFKLTVSVTMHQLTFRRVKALHPQTEPTTSATSTSSIIRKY